MVALKGFIRGGLSEDSMLLSTGILMPDKRHAVVGYSSKISIEKFEAKQKLPKG
jgi:hypothetical protein